MVLRGWADPGLCEEQNRWESSRVVRSSGFQPGSCPGVSRDGRVRLPPSRFRGDLRSLVFDHPVYEREIYFIDMNANEKKTHLFWYQSNAENSSIIWINRLYDWVCFRWFWSFRNISGIRDTIMGDLKGKITTDSTTLFPPRCTLYWAQTRKGVLWG